MLKKYTSIIAFIMPILLAHISCREKPLTKQPKLFNSENLLELKIIAPLQTIFKDIEEKRFYHKAQISYTNNHSYINIPVEIKTRGYFRRDSNVCNIIPLKLKFKKKDVKKTYFENQNKLKLVLPCHDDSSGNQFLLREYLAYKLYEHLTPYSFKVQLCDLTLNDLDNKMKETKVYAFLIENKKKMAKRNNATIIETPYLENSQVDSYQFGFMSIFQYMIGNNDWSTYYLHNIKLLKVKDSYAPLTVPYDFDMSDFVDALYCYRNSKETNKSKGSYLEEGRKYMGNPISKAELEYILNIYRKKKDTILFTISNFELLTESSKNYCLNYIKEFYETIDSASTFVEILDLKISKQ